MGVATRVREDDVRYSYDPASKALHVDLVSTAPPFATINARVDLSEFEPRAWLGDAHAAKAARVEQLSLTYQDGGYLAQRNRFCAQLTNTDAAGYAARHLAAVKAFLEARGIVPGDEVAALYGKLVAEGGSAELSSLPEAAFVPADFASYAPEDLLRQLNVTLRRNTAPPILMRLAFNEPVPGAANETLVANATDAPATAPINNASPSPVAEPTPVSSTATTSAPAEEASTLATIEPVKLPEPARSEGLPLLSVANAAVLPIEAPPAPHLEVPADVLAVATAPAAITSDKANAAPSELAATPWSTARPGIDPRNAVEAIPASAPAPLPGSTAALVWRAPTIERLPEKSPATSAWMSVSAGSLGVWRGALRARADRGRQGHRGPRARRRRRRPRACREPRWRQCRSAPSVGRHPRRESAARLGALDATFSGSSSPQRKGRAAATRLTARPACAEPEPQAQPSCDAPRPRPV